MTKNNLTLLLLFITYISLGQTEEQYNRIADSLTKIGQQEKLISFFQKELKSKPKNETLLCWLGYLNIENRQFELGEKYYREALVINPKCSNCYLNIGRIYANKNENKKAFEYFDKAISIAPTKAEAYSIRAQLKIATGDKLGALADLNKNIELDPKSAFPYLQRAEYNSTQGYSSIALFDINKAVELAPQYYYPYFRRASVYYEKRMIQEALTDINKAISLDSMQENLYAGRGAIYASLNKHKEAITDYTKAIQLNPNDFFPYYNRSMDKYALEDMDGSCADLQASYALLEKYDPTNTLKAELDYSIGNYCDSSKPSYYYQRGIALYNFQQYEKAIHMYTVGLKKFPNNSMMLSFRGNAYLALKDFNPALIDYAASIKNKENLNEDIAANQKHTRLLGESIDTYSKGLFAFMQISIAEAKFGLGQYENALTEINKGIELAPDLKEIGKENYFNVRGNIFLALGKYQQALNDFEKCIQLNPSFALAYANRAITKINLNNNISMTTRSIKIGIDNQTFNANWGFPLKTSFKKNDSNTSALQDCNKAIELNPNLELAYYVRGQLKKALIFGDYCYDLIKANDLGYPVEQELLTNCKN